jgi:hypothetical protein
MDKSKIIACINLRKIDKTRLLKNLSGQLLVKLEIILLEKQKKNGDQIIINQFTAPGEKKIEIGYGQYSRPGTIELSVQGIFDPERDEGGLGF